MVSFSGGIYSLSTSTHAVCNVTIGSQVFLCYMVHLYTSEYHGLSIRRRCLQIERNSERRVCVQ